MTDAPDGSGPVPRRPPRSTDGGAPVSGALAIVLAIVAVVAGFLILRSISDDGDNDLGVGVDTGNDGDVASSSTNPGSSLPTASTATTLPPLQVDGAMVVVANANGIAGSAAAMSNALEAGPHFTMGDPEDAADELGILDASVIYFDATQAAGQAVAQSLARVLGGNVTVQPLQGTPPVQDGDISGAGVLLLLGTDKANKTLEELNPENATTVITNPPVAASSTAAG